MLWFNAKKEIVERHYYLDDVLTFEEVVRQNIYFFKTLQECLQRANEAEALELMGLVL